MNKIKQPSIIKKKPAKECAPKTTFRDHYREFFMYRDMPVSDGFLEKLASELIEYVEDPKLDNEFELMRIEAFFHKRRISMRTVQTWKLRNSDFAEVYDMAKLYLGMRRDNGAMRRKFDASTVHFTMPDYDPNWKELTEWRAKLKAESEATQVPQTVIFKAFE